MIIITRYASDKGPGRIKAHVQDNNFVDDEGDQGATLEVTARHSMFSDGASVAIRHGIVANLLATLVAGKPTVFAHMDKVKGGWGFYYAGDKP